MLLTTRQSRPKSLRTYLNGEDRMSLIEQRRSFTNEVIEKLVNELQLSKKLAEGKACIYATGSYGRSEASKFSDIDLFIVGRSASSRNHEQEQQKLLNNLDEICVKADLITAVRKIGLKDLDGDGRFLTQHTIEGLSKSIGHPEDDYSNTLTARLLMLLESRPIIGEEILREAKSHVIQRYWRDYAGREKNFIPAYFTNDVLRFWRTLCLNYEAFTSDENEADKIKRNVKLYKLKNSRMLLCYSALLYLCFLYGTKNTVTIDDILTISDLTPLQRIEQLVTQTPGRNAHQNLSMLIKRYEEFLEFSALSVQEQ